MVFTGAVAGAEDWIVVKVVVKLRTDAGGEENVLLWSPSVLAAVPDVPTPDGAWSDTAVSAVVPSVGARDLGWPGAPAALS